MEFIKEIYDLTFMYRYLNDFESLGLVWIVVVIGFNYVTIRDILIKDNPLYIVIFWISFSISITFPGLYIKLLLISYDYIPLEYFNFFNERRMILLGYTAVLIPILYIFLYILYAIFYIFRSRFFTRNNFYRVRGSKKHWDFIIPDRILHIVATILVFGMVARYIFIILFLFYGEDGKKIPTTNITISTTKSVTKKDTENVPINLNDVVIDYEEKTSSEFVSQEEIDEYRKTEGSSKL